MALDSAAALARLCHMVAGLWEAGWRESFSARDSIMAYAWGRGRWITFNYHTSMQICRCILSAKNRRVPETLIS